MLGPRLAPPIAIGMVVMTLSAVSTRGQAQTTRESTKKGTGAWAVPRTPDGQPDMQGVWVSNSATPLERPKALENRTTLTDEEVAELKKRADRIFKDGGSSYMLPLRRKPEQIYVYEFACHEGNYSMEGALRGARADDKKAESAKSTAK